MWVRWIDAFGIVYQRGWQCTWLKLRELVDSEGDIEYAPVARLEVLLAPLPFPPTNSSKSSMIEDSCSIDGESRQKLEPVGVEPECPKYLPTTVVLSFSPFPLLRFLFSLAI